MLYHAKNVLQRVIFVKVDIYISKIIIGENRNIQMKSMNANLMDVVKKRGILMGAFKGIWAHYVRSVIFRVITGHFHMDLKVIHVKDAQIFTMFILS